MSTPHIACEMGDIAERVILPGDPLRAERIAKDYLTDVTCVSKVRGNGIYPGKWQGEPISVMASGMGIPTTHLYATELFRFFGVKRICRVGTAGGIAKSVKVKDVIIASSAHTNSRIAEIQVPDVTVSLTASFDMLSAAVAKAKEADFRFHVGPVYSSDYFYLNRPDITEALAKIGTLGVEMESAALFGVAAIEGTEALTVLTVSDHLFDGSGDLTADERETIFQNALEVGVAALFA